MRIFTNQSWQKLCRKRWIWRLFRVIRFNGYLSTKLNGTLMQHTLRTFTSGKRLDSDFGKNYFPNKDQECYHKGVNREHIGKNLLSTGNSKSGSVKVELEVWLGKESFFDGDYKTFRDALTSLHVAAAKSTRSVVGSTTKKDCVKLNFADGYGIGVLETSLFDVLGFTGVQLPYRDEFFIANNNKVEEQTQPIKGDYPPSITAGWKILFVNCDIIEHQHMVNNLFFVSLIQKHHSETVTYETRLQRNKTRS